MQIYLFLGLVYLCAHDDDDGWDVFLGTELAGRKISNIKMALFPLIPCLCLTEIRTELLI